MRQRFFQQKQKIILLRRIILASFFLPLFFIFGFSRCCCSALLPASSIMSSLNGTPILRRSSARLSSAAAAMRSVVRKAEDDGGCCVPSISSTPSTKRPRVAVRVGGQQQQSDFVTPGKTAVPSSPVMVTPSADFITDKSSTDHDILRRDGFVDLGIPPGELRPSATLTTGQCFHWRAVNITTVAAGDTTQAANDSVAAGSSSQKKKQQQKRRNKSSAWGSHDATEWIGTLRVPVTGESWLVVLRETPRSVWYKTLHEPQSPSAESLDARAFLYSYFQLPPGMETNEQHSSEESSSSCCSLRELYGQWSAQCRRLERIAACIPGVRIVDQDPWECLVSFLCSSNNNIPRITQMLNRIRCEYGEPLVCITAVDTNGDDDGDEQASSSNHVLYSFPSLETLKARATESDLRKKCGMGYRAKYLMETIKILDSLGGERYLQELRSISDPMVVQEKLLQFSGVGRKVADCVALFSLRQCDAVPVDVHVWDIARRDYGADEIVQTAKSLTPTIYRQIGDLFRTRFPNKSGWAHSLLFVAELPSFRPVLPDDIVEEMEQFRLEQKAKKKKKGK